MNRTSPRPQSYNYEPDTLTTKPHDALEEGGWECSAWTAFDPMSADISLPKWPKSFEPMSEKVNV